MNYPLIKFCCWILVWILEVSSGFAYAKSFAPNRLSVGDESGANVGETVSSVPGAIPGTSVASVTTQAIPPTNTATAAAVTVVNELDVAQNCFVTLQEGIPVQQCMAPSVNADGSYIQVPQKIKNPVRWLPSEQYSRNVLFTQKGDGSRLRADVESRVTQSLIESNLNSPLAIQLRAQIKKEIEGGVAAEYKKNNPTASPSQVTAAVDSAVESALPLRLSKQLSGQIKERTDAEMAKVADVERQRSQIEDEVRKSMGSSLTGKAFDAEVDKRMSGLGFYDGNKRKQIAEAVKKEFGTTLTGQAFEDEVDKRMKAAGLGSSYRQNLISDSKEPAINPCGANAKVAAVSSDGLKFLCKNADTKGDKAGKTFVMERGKRDEKKVAELGVDDSLNFTMAIDPASPCAKIPNVTSSMVSEDGKSYYCGQKSNKAVVMNFNEGNGKWTPKVIDPKKLNELDERNKDIVATNTRQMGMENKVVIAKQSINVYVDNGNGCEKQPGKLWLNAGQPLIYDPNMWKDECYRENVLRPLGISSGKLDRRLIAKGNMICDVRLSPHGGTFTKASEPPGLQECTEAVGKYNCTYKGGGGKISVEDQGLNAKDYFDSNRVCAQRQAFSPLVDDNKESVIQDGSCNFYSYDPTSCCLITRTTNGPEINPSCQKQAEKDKKDIQSKAEALTGVGSYGYSDHLTGKIKKDAIDSVFGFDLKECVGRYAFDPVKNLECAAEMSEKLAQREAIAGLALIGLGVYTLTQCEEKDKGGSGDKKSSSDTATSTGMSTGAMAGMAMLGLPLLMGAMGSMGGKSDDKSGGASGDDDMKKRIEGLKEASTATVTESTSTKTSSTAASNKRAPSSSSGASGSGSASATSTSSVSEEQAQKDRAAQANNYQQNANPMKPYNDCMATTKGDARLVEECKKLMPEKP